ncbi:uncharacterized protein LOC125230578 [Leguminivora glycinivorella]|uniref:uncharacterized protein LOC125230578 n=1 Tax=Leguminivora glycinivorella TaxID=1035111 RepID=UPI00200BC25D|nr:uncharacterized protein LOC125230578 [Leguminivora glycinivorella]
MATRLLKTNSEPPMPIKHNLPCTVFPHKGSYIRKPTFVIKEKTRSQTTAELETQTENYFKTEEEIHILDIVKDSGLSSEELQNRLADNMQEKEKNSDDKSITTIDLEDDSEDANDLYAKVMKHSTNNKLVLNKIAKIFQKSKPSLPSFDPNPPSTSPTAEPCRALVERPTASPISAAGELADTLKPTIDDLQKGLVFSVMLQQMGFRLVRTEPQTQATQTEENRGNIRKRRRVFAKDDNQSVNELMGHFEQNIQRTPVAPVRPSHELSALAPEVQDVAVFQAHNSPRQQQPQQTPPHYVSEHERPSQYYPHMSALMSPQEQQRAQNTAPRSSHLSSTAAHNPFEQNQNNNTFSTSQSPVQMQNQVQRYPSQRRQSVHGPPHLSRVMSTQEANMHGSQAQQPSWGYPPYYEQNVYSQRHQ